MKKIITYISIIGVFVFLIWVIVEKGNGIVRDNKTEISQNAGNANYSDKAQPVVIDSNKSIFHQLTNNIKSP